MASHEQKDERYFQIEKEGRIISSLVALVACALTLASTNAAVALLIGSMSFDLWRCA
jgi:NifU-like protein involved in Fe-S cluster formation